MKRYRKKPVVVEAVKWGGNTELLPGTIGVDWVVNRAGDVALKTDKGVKFVSIEDWVIRGAKGELYPCRDDIFRATYEEVEGEDCSPDQSG